MAFEADRVAVELIATTDGFDAKIKQSADKFDQATGRIGKASKETEQLLEALRRNLDEALSAGQSQKAALLAANIEKIEAAARKAGVAVGGVGKGVAGFDQAAVKGGRSAGQMRSAMQQLGFQAQDVAMGFSMGVRPMTIFAQQGGQVVQALQLMGGGGSKFLTFLGGPWGVGLSVAAVALTPLIAKLFETKNEVDKLVDKMREQAKQAGLSEHANRIWESSLDGLIEKTRKLADETTKLLETEEQRRTKSLSEAAQAKDRFVNERRAIERDLAAAREELARRQQFSAGTADDARVVQQRKRVEELARRYNELSAAIAEASTGIANLGIIGARSQAEILADPAKKIREHFQALKETAEATIKDVDKLTERLTLLNKQEAAAIKNLQQRDKEARLPAVTGAEIARALGTTVTSGARTPAQNKAVDGAANSYHLTGQAIDIPLTVNGKPLTKEGIRATLAPLGVGIKELLGPGDKGHADHFHIAFDKKRLGPDQVADAQQKASDAADRAAEQALRRQNAFEEARDRLNGVLLQAQAALSRSIEEQAHFAQQQAFSDERRLNAAIQNDVEEGKLTQAQADSLKALNHSVTIEKLKAIELDKRMKLLQEENRDAEQSAKFRVDGLEYQDEIARSEADHRRIQLEILDVVYAQKKAQLERLKLIAEGNGDLAEANRIQAQINNLPAEQARDEGRARRGTMGPFESFLDSIPQGAAEANEALEAMAVGGIQSVVDGLAQAGTEWIKLGGTAGKIINQLIADLIRLVLYQQVLGPLAKLIGGGSSVAGITPFSTPGALDDYVPGAASGITGTIGGRGGVDNNILSINGKPSLRVSKGETLAVIPSNAAAAPAGGGGGNTYISVPIYANDAVLAETVKGWVREGVAVAIQGGARGGAALARDGLARKTLHRLG